ncbi:MAG: PAS domain S-box protein, partial [Alphaproteobacteria bacterium]|nr:PAS domain S-box protein [Alphaproteobacteria bacterium]
MAGRKNIAKIGSLPLVQDELAALAETLFELGKSGMIILDSVGKITAVNGALCDFFGDTRENLTGLLPKFLFAGAETPAEYNDFIHTLITKGRYDGRTRSRNHHGEMIPIDIHFSEIRNHIGETNHYVGLCVPHPAASGSSGDFSQNIDPLTGLLSAHGIIPR